MHSLNGALPGPYVPVRVTRCWFDVSPALCRTSVSHIGVLMCRFAAERGSMA